MAIIHETLCSTSRASRHVDECENDGWHCWPCERGRWDLRTSQSKHDDDELARKISNETISKYEIEPGRTNWTKAMKRPARLACRIWVANMQIEKSCSWMSMKKERKSDDRPKRQPKLSMKVRDRLARTSYCIKDDAAVANNEMMPSFGTQIHTIDRPRKISRVSGNIWIVKEELNHNITK